MTVAVDESIRIYNMFEDERNKAVKNLVRYLEQVVFFQRNIAAKVIFFNSINAFCIVLSI